METDVHTLFSIIVNKIDCYNSAVAISLCDTGSLGIDIIDTSGYLSIISMVSVTSDPLPFGICSELGRLYHSQVLAFILF